MFALITAFLLVGLFRRRWEGTAGEEPVSKPDPSAEHRLQNVVVACVGLTVVIRFG